MIVINPSPTAVSNVSLDSTVVNQSEAHAEPKLDLLNRRSRALFICISLVFVAARLWHLTSYGVFGDEVFTIWTAEQDWASLFASVIGDVVHPPLFYLLLKLWIGIGGQSQLWMKLLPLLLSIGSLVPLLFLCRELNLKAGPMNLALWLVAVNGFLINHSQELRMYSLLFLLSVSSLWFFARLVNRTAGSSLTQFQLFAVNLLLVFTHYYGWMVVGLELIFLLVWKRTRLRSFSIAVAVLAVCFLPWVYVVHQASLVNPSRVNFVWNQPPPLSELIGFYGNLNGALSYRWKVFGTAAVMILFWSPIIKWGWRVSRKRESARSTMTFCWLALFAFGPALVSFVASHALPQPVWAFRYLIIASPAYLLLVAEGAYRLRPARLRLAAVGLIVCWSSLSCFAEISNRDQISWQPLVERMIRLEDQPDVNLYVTDANVGNTVQYYLDQAGETRFQVSFVNGFESVGDDHFWVAFIRYRHETAPLIHMSLVNVGYDTGNVIEAQASAHKAVLFQVWKHR